MPTHKQLIMYRRRRFALIISAVAIIVISSIVVILNIKIDAKPDADPVSTQQANVTDVSQTSEAVPEFPKRAYPSIPENVKLFSKEDVSGENAVLLDLENNKVIASRKCTDKINPASLTKVMSLVVAVENIKDFNDTYTMTYEIINPLINSDATRAGFVEGEVCKLSDLLYGAILPSGADATIALAEYISGSEEEFVKLMNAKAIEIGLQNTNFTNTSGLHDSNHYTTALDMAVVMQYAMENDVCKKILSTYKFTTSPTEQHPEGIALESTMFSRMYGTEVENVKINAGKTGYTTEAGHCLVSYAEKDGKRYIGVSMKAPGKYKPIFDIFEIYRNYLPSPQVQQTATSETSVSAT